MKTDYGFMFYGGLAFAGIFLAAYLVFFHLFPFVHAWEKAAGYPYGKMCEIYKTCNR